MALTLIKEDGTGRTDANSYATVAEADSYFEAHLYASAWTAATAGTKAAALVMATRLVDSQYQFHGYRAHDTQALQWPRERCPDPDRNLVTSTTLSPVLTNFVPSTQVPPPVSFAVCEMARELLIADRTAAPAGEGIESTATSTHTKTSSSDTSNSSTTKYSKSDTRPIISRVAQAMLSKYGTLMVGGSGSVQLVRA
ncbi:MAG TPA: hypothetical protein PKI20_08715 [Verrucomicrobiota bacterium]|nr:hypothetical protein [Verrucomicrobiota bacterium]HQL80335.1 hypothetical protein [Verrucomicrobiota bacterium]